MKIGYVVDTKFSALGISAISRARTNPDITVIEALNFFTVFGFLKYLKSEKFDLIIFSWRFLAYELFCLRFVSNSMKKLGNYSSIAVVIPDHLGVEGPQKDREILLLNEVDYFLVTSKILFNHYRPTYPNKCKGILHDLPNIELIELARSRSPEERNGLIWVGNSKWGERMGYRDHKRFREIVVNLISKGHKIHLVDSAHRWIENSTVINTIAQNFFLLQSSKSEGTGLPVLEAAALGTVPITTRVGVAEEFMSGELGPLLVEPTVEDFEAALIWGKENHSWLPTKLKERFDEYVRISAQEKIFYESESAPHGIRTSLMDEIRISSKWMIRSTISRTRFLIRVKIKFSQKIL